MADQSRLDVLEGRVEELSRNSDRMHGQVAGVDRKIDEVFRDLSVRIVALEDKVDRRIDALEQRFDRRFEVVDRKMDDLRAELSKQFRWTFSTMLALLGMMLTVGAGVARALLRN
jgi:hypothetical protein